MRNSDNSPTRHFSSPLPPGSGPAPLVDAVVRLIRDTVERQPTPILGTHLAALIRATFPTFRYHQHNVGQLREFLEKHVPEVAVIGRQGGDVLYAWRTDKQAHPVTVPALTPKIGGAEEAWRAFSSPNSQRIVIMQVNVESGAWRSVDPATQEGGGWRNVLPLPSEEHRAIAWRFLESLADDQRKLELESALGQPRWWIGFRSKLARHDDLQTLYRVFRSTELVRALTEALRNVGLSQPAQATALAPIGPRVFAGRQGGQVVVTKVAGHGSGADGHASEAAFRAFALRILGQLPMRELREVSVRLGDVFDALGPK